MSKADLTLQVEDTMVDVLKSAVEPAKDEDKILEPVFKGAHLNDEEKGKVRLAMRMLSGFGGKLEGGIMQALAQAAGSDMKKGMSEDEHKAAFKVAVKKAVDVAVEKDVALALEKAEKPKRKILKSADGQEFDVTDDSETSRANTEALIKSLDKAHAESAELKTEQTRRDIVAKSETDYPHLDAKVISEILQKSDEETATKIHEVLKQAEELAKKAPLDELGAAGGAGGGSSAWAKIEALAKTAVQKSIGTDEPITQPKAIDAVLKTDEGKVLWAEHNKEARAPS